MTKARIAMLVGLLPLLAYAGEAPQPRDISVKELMTRDLAGATARRF